MPPAAARTTVLVVDDEADLRSLVVEMLEMLGYAALEAADGPEALRLLESQQHIDLLLTDVGLPEGMNGRQLADAARVIRPELKVLFITGYAANAALRDGLVAQGMHVMTKPFALDALGSKLAGMIDPAPAPVSERD
jgi:CheY-like chemotaxis protein